jgi:hypothetical protein
MKIKMDVLKHFINIQYIKMVREKIMLRLELTI